MNKTNIKVDVLKKIISRFEKAAPAKRPEPPEPLGRLIRAFLEYDCDEARADAADKKLQSVMVDHNELRVTPAIELAAILGSRFPFAESRCSSLHRTLQSLFDREHQMRMERVKEMKKHDIRSYFQGLTGITPYVEAAVCVDCFGIPAIPVDTKLLLWLTAKEVFPEGMDIKTAQHHLEKHVKAPDAWAFFHGSRKEIEDWSPKSWPVVAKPSSPVLAPPPLDAHGVEIKVQHPEEPPKPVIAAKAAPLKGGKKAEAAAEKKVVVKPPEPKGKPAAPLGKKK
jgi:endonuclease III